MSEIYYSGFPKEQIKINVSSRPWGLMYNQEEHRTICGVPKEQIPPLFHYGDELFENLFVASINCKFQGKRLFFRHGHSETGLSDFYFLEDEDVIIREIDTINQHWQMFATNYKPVGVLKLDIISGILRGEVGLGGFFFPKID